MSEPLNPPPRQWPPVGAEHPGGPLGQGGPAGPLAPGGPFGGGGFGGPPPPEEPLGGGQWEPPLRKPARRARTILVAAAVSAVLAGGVFAYVMSDDERPDTSTAIVDRDPRQPTPTAEPTPFAEDTSTSPSPTTSTSGSASPSAAPRPTGSRSASARPPAAAGDTEPVRLGISRRLTDTRIRESSGLALSRLHPGLLWTHNDSGDGPHLYAVGPNGGTRTRITLQGATAADWEAMAPGRDRSGRPVLWVGDVGDNNAQRGTIDIYRMFEPSSLAPGTVPATRYRFRYADGPHDAEALLVHPRTGRLYVVMKRDTDAGIYAAPAQLRTGDAINVLERVADAPPTITDGAFLPDGRVVLRNYTTGFVAPSIRGPWRSFPLPQLQQAESLASNAAGTGAYVGSEGGNSPVWMVPLP